jgi:hypothetical protein
MPRKSTKKSRRRTSSKRKIMTGGKRKMTAYAKFVKAHYHDADIQRLPSKQRFAALAKKYAT